MMNPQQELAFYYKLLRQHCLNDSHSGNGSVRNGNGFIITKTGACADIIQADELINCALELTLPKNVSLDAGIHQKIYQQLTGCKAVLHAHNPYTIASTLSSDDFTPVDFEGQLYFSKLPIIDCAHEDYIKVMPTRIADCLKKDPIAIVRSHGVYAAADSLELAYKWLCSIEQSAKIKWLAKQL